MMCLILLTVDLRTIGISDSPIIVDQSPPVAGVVYDGDHSGEDLVYMKDNNKVIDMIRFISTMQYIQLFLQLSIFCFFCDHFHSAKKEKLQRLYLILFAIRNFKLQKWLMQIEMLHTYSFLRQEKRGFIWYFKELQVLYQCQSLHKILICFKLM